MSDKFKINAFIIALATISILVIHRIANAQIQISEVEYITIQPDIMVFITALCVMNVMSVLTTELAKINPIKMLPYLYYPMAIGIAALLSILLHHPKHYS
jgi:Na+/H+ antiporter family protein